MKPTATSRERGGSFPIEWYICREECRRAMLIFLSDVAEEEEIDNGPAVVLPSSDDAAEDLLDELDDNVGVDNVRRSIESNT